MATRVAVTKAAAKAKPEATGSPTAINAPIGHVARELGPVTGWGATLPLVSRTEVKVEPSVFGDDNVPMYGGYGYVATPPAPVEEAVTSVRLHGDVVSIGEHEHILEDGMLECPDCIAILVLRHPELLR